MEMSNTNKPYDFLIKLLTVGDSDAGKTDLLLKFCGGNASPENSVHKCGIDFKTKIIDVDDKKIKMQIWDTAGQERFKTVTTAYFKGATGIILVYACNSRVSFNSTEYWMEQIKQHADEDVCKVIVGNKSDAVDRQVTYEEGKKLADRYGIQFYETNINDDLGINNMFYSITKKIKEKILSKEQPNNDRKITLDSNNQKRNNTRAQCC